MTEWARNYGSTLAEALGFPNGKTPSVGTLHSVFSRVDKAALEKALSNWTQSIVSQLPQHNALSIDGKTLCGSKKQGANEAHLLSAVSHGLGLTLFQCGVSDKTNEIGAVQEVLQALVLEGRVVTVDALLTQKDIAEQIVSLGGTS
jgi:hypothetical protein